MRFHTKSIEFLFNIQMLIQKNLYEHKICSIYSLEELRHLVDRSITNEFSLTFVQLFFC